MASPTHPPSTEEVKRYERQKLVIAIVSVFLNVAVLAPLAFFVGPRLDLVLGSTLGDNRWVRLIGLGFVYAVILDLVHLPLSYYGTYVLEHKFGLSKQTLAAWVWKRIKGYLVGGPLGLVLLLGFYALLWYGGDWWWVWATVALLAVTLVLGRVLPVLILPLFYKVTRLDDADLLGRLRHISDGTGLEVEGVYRLHLSDETRKANAALAGLGRTRRVLLGDTLLDAFTPEEIEVVFAHEVGHHVHRHLPKLVAMSVVFSAVGFWLVDRILKSTAEPLGYASFSDPAALPLVMFVLMMFGLVLSPLENAISRFFERQCDRYALERTRKPEAYRSAFTKLAEMNKTDPDPNPVVVWLFDDHPPIRERLALADSVAGHPSPTP